MLSMYRSLTIKCICILLSGCGLAVPSLEEPWRDKNEAPLLVHDVTRSIHCEVRNAILGAIDADRRIAATLNRPRRFAWIDGWGVQTTLQLTVEEKSSLSPSLSLIHNMGDAVQFRNLTRVVTAESRSFGLEGKLSSTATRINKLYSFYTVADLSSDTVNCSELSRDPTKSLLLQDDLRLREWLSNVNLSYNSGDIRFDAKPKAPFDANAISHEIKFQVVSSGSITPSWKLATVSVNQAGPFFDTSRDRTHDLIITLGPTVPDPNDRKRRVLAPTAFNAANNSDIATTLSSAIRSSLQP